MIKHLAKGVRSFLGALTAGAQGTSSGWGGGCVLLLGHYTRPLGGRLGLQRGLEGLARWHLMDSADFHLKNRALGRGGRRRGIMQIAAIEGRGSSFSGSWRLRRRACDLTEPKRGKNGSGGREIR